jgi:hypothetical protein
MLAPATNTLVPLTAPPALIRPDHGPDRTVAHRPAGLHLATLLGAYEQMSTPAAVLGLPIAAWELSLGLWMIVKGFAAASPIATPRSSR